MATILTTPNRSGWVLIFQYCELPSFTCKFFPSDKSCTKCFTLILVVIYNNLNNCSPKSSWVEGLIFHHDTISRNEVVINNDYHPVFLASILWIRFEFILNAIWIQFEFTYGTQFSFTFSTVSVHVEYGVHLECRNSTVWTKTVYKLYWKCYELYWKRTCKLKS